MAIPVARVHLAMAHSALPALLPTPPKLEDAAAAPDAAILLPKPFAKPGRADSDERWDARKTKPACTEPKASSSPRKNATSPPREPGRADSVHRWDAHKKAGIPASSSSSSGTSSLISSSSKWPISRVSSAERWDVHKKRRPPQAETLDDGESSSTGSNDIDTEEEILYMEAGPGFAVAAPESSMLPMPTAFLAPVA